ncbi:MAG TPA: glutamate--tRNA ligase [Acidimicrobiales bacterium]|nr:glutamate--tRNA ligase [Acidimicrobiales bacterium]
MGSPVRVRFAPSPTGFFHVGSARAALYNWLFARQVGGTFVLRIEDTDAERNRPEWVEMIQTSMRWLGLDWDEGPYFQSQRSDLYRAAVDRLVSTGHAYYCTCTREDVDARTKGSATPGYDSFCRDRGLSEGALRFATPDEGTTVVRDLVRGEPAFENVTIEDFVVARTNGTPTFILANVVDDLDMKMTHVVRGEDHLPNTPKYLLLWSALADDAEVPVFAHLPLLVNEKRQKLSKRRDKVALEDYREQGYLPQAMVNYLALLGWAPGGDREFLSIDELVAEFRLEEVNNSPAFFDEKKLAHFNQQYIAAMSVDEFVAAALPFVPPSGEEALRSLAPLVQERIKVLGEVPGMIDFLLVDEVVFVDATWDKRVVRGAHAAELLAAAASEYATCEWEVQALHDLTAAIGERFELGLGKAQFPIRVAVMGRDVGPPLFESLVVLGRERTLARLQRAQEKLAEAQ